MILSLTIQIDDSGTGDVIGPAFIGLMRVETSKILIKQIPVELFNDANWMYKKPHAYIVELIRAGLKELDYQKTERIILCRAAIFDVLRSYFIKERIRYEDGVIEGPLQDAVEKKLESYFIEIGIDGSKLDKEACNNDHDKGNYYHYRNRILREWVVEDYKNRLKYVKTGYKNAYARIRTEAEQKKTIDNILKLIKIKLYDKALEEIEKGLSIEPNNSLFLSTKQKILDLTSKHKK